VSGWTARELAAALGLPVPAGDSRHGEITTDTRALASGAVFVALVGERFDGHAFLGAATAAGATAAVVREGTPPVAGLTLFAVPDTGAALGRLATHRRRRVGGPVVAITGTNGKTATKEMAAAVLAARWRVHTTRGNLNNEIGVPLTLLAAPDGTEALVVEAGASVPGELARLRAVIEPTAAVITNVSAGHLEGFGNLEGVLAEKLSLAHSVPLVVVGTEPPGLAAGARALAGETIVAGLEAPADLRPDRWEMDATGHAHLVFRGAEVRVPLAGRHQASNAMLALALGDRLGVAPAAGGAALAAARVPGGRWETHAVGDRTVINDAYNANPASMLAAFDTIRAVVGNRPLVLLLGTMRELGTAEAEAHARIADAAVRLGPAVLGAVGAFVPALERHARALGERLVTASDADALGRAVAPRVPARAVVLLKASRGVRMEQALPHLLQAREASCSTTS
jgi:UDP-N-acetylmuramoyl-tripeptide--D-alanyl-D-alanine ligase